jgi:hypothetical protein
MIASRHYIEDIAGQTYGRLTAIEYKGNRSYINKHGRKVRVGQVWECECECGERKVVAKSNLVSGNIQSCNCLHRELARQAISKVHPGNTGKVFRKEESLPDYDIGFIKAAWLVFDGFVYQAATCPDMVLHHAICVAIIGKRPCNDFKETLFCLPYDLYTRWWLFLELKKMKREIVLYPSRNDAFQALKEKADTNTKAS